MMDNSLAEKLKRLGMKLGSEHIPLLNPDLKISIPSPMVIPGEIIDNHVRVIVIEFRKMLDREHVHGQTTLIIDGEIGLVADWAHSSHLRNQTC